MIDKSAVPYYSTLMFIVNVETAGQTITQECDDVSDAEHVASYFQRPGARVTITDSRTGKVVTSYQC